ncbi:MARH1 [Hepatospora eriocheir]|uniref:MARH1 n=1 Tax=Hepatospora eriocheir TaxID=1081669 RepID=A0A1X0QHQ1_9MICR|nr:MARH1 [Hepatospora eriocheir]
METERICRYCFLDGCEKNPLISPCNCNGSIRYVHRNCLNQWRYFYKDPSKLNICEQCHSEYSIVDEPFLIKLFIRLSSILVVGFGCLFSAILITLLINLLENIDGDSNSTLQVYQILILFTSSLISIYSLFTKISIFSLINYFFTVLRLIKYHFIIDYFIVLAYSSFILYYLYSYVSLKFKVMFIYLLNRI